MFSIIFIFVLCPHVCLTVVLRFPHLRGLVLCFATADSIKSRLRLFWGCRSLALLTTVAPLTLLGFVRSRCSLGWPFEKLHDVFEFTFECLLKCLELLMVDAGIHVQVPSISIKCLRQLWLFILWQVFEELLSRVAKVGRRDKSRVEPQSHRHKAKVF